jgi:hypothetical protein
MAVFTPAGIPGFEATHTIRGRDVRKKVTDAGVVWYESPKGKPVSLGPHGRAIPVASKPAAAPPEVTAPVEIAPVVLPPTKFAASGRPAAELTAMAAYAVLQAASFPHWNSPHGYGFSTNDDDAQLQPGKGPNGEKIVRICMKHGHTPTYYTVLVPENMVFELAE